MILLYENGLYNLFSCVLILESSKFCENWAQVLLTQGTSSPDPFFLRQAIENYKLKVRHMCV